MKLQPHRKKQIIGRAKDLLFYTKTTGKFNYNKAKCGVTFTFFRINRWEGFKFTKKKKVRDSSYKLQKIAAKYNLAPPVANKISFQHGKKKYYGFVTKLADLGGISYAEGLYNDLYSIGIRHNDLHEENVGWYKNRLVCIDFDPVSLRC